MAHGLGKVASAIFLELAGVLVVGAAFVSSWEARVVLLVFGLLLGWAVWSNSQVMGARQCSDCRAKSDTGG
jgi:hypothetical protein